ncbi:pyrD [Tasmannia lanceolata]|uniref:pyrD n=1 Tax=Tasmannia lanceolata TaxID=3420 RepID=UPI00406405C1
MSLACLVCHSVDSPSHSFRSYSVSSSDNEGRCSRIVNCLNRKVSLHPESANTMMTSKVTPQPLMGNTQGITGAPRLVRSRAVRRDLVRDWNFDEALIES